MGITLLGEREGWWGGGCDSETVCLPHCSEEVIIVRVHQFKVVVRGYMDLIFLVRLISPVIVD